MDAEEQEEAKKLTNLSKEKSLYTAQMVELEVKSLSAMGQLNAVKERQQELDVDFEQLKKDSSKLTVLVNDLRSKVQVTKEKIDDNNHVFDGVFKGATSQ